MADLERIIQLRNVRYDKLLRKQSLAEEALEAARETLLRARNEMDAFAEKMRTLEIELLTELLNTRLHKTDFDIFSEKLKKAEEETADLVRRHDQAALNFQKNERAMERVGREAQEVQSKINKLNQLRSVIAEEERGAELRAVDAQSDDIAATIFARLRKQ